MSKEKAIELLKQVLKPLLACEPQCKLNLNVRKLEQALAELEQPKCKTCSGSGEIKQVSPMKMSGSVSSVPDVYHIPCPDCQPAVLPDGKQPKPTKELERTKEALQRIDNWAKAYPLRVFPEPDFKKVAEVLKAAGLSLDAVSASNMRHVIKGIKDIAEQALKDK